MVNRRDERTGKWFIIVVILRRRSAAGGDKPWLSHGEVAVIRLQKSDAGRTKQTIMITATSSHPTTAFFQLSSDHHDQQKVRQCLLA